MPESQKENRDISPTSVSGATIRKKSKLDRFAGELYDDLAKNVKDYVWYDLILRSIKDTVMGTLGGFFEALSRAIDNVIFDGRAPRNQKSYQGSRVSYGSYYRSPASYSQPRPVRQEERSNYDDDEVFISDMDPKSGVKNSPLVTKQKATDLIDTANECIDVCGYFSVLDLKDKIEKTGTPEDDNWGWTEPLLCKPRRVLDGYIIDFPKPRPLAKR